MRSVGLPRTSGPVPDGGRWEPPGSAETERFRLIQDLAAFARRGTIEVMRTLRTSIAAVVVGLVLAPAVVRADPVGVVKESGRTAGHSVRDGSLTLGRTVRDFFVHGPRRAKSTWKSNAAQTRTTARADKERVKAEANE